MWDEEPLAAPCEAMVEAFRRQGCEETGRTPLASGVGFRLTAQKGEEQIDATCDRADARLETRG